MFSFVLRRHACVQAAVFTCSQLDDLIKSNHANNERDRLSASSIDIIIVIIILFNTVYRVSGGQLYRVLSCVLYNWKFP